MPEIDTRSMSDWWVVSGESATLKHTLNIYVSHLCYKIVDRFKMAEDRRIGIGIVRVDQSATPLISASPLCLCLSLVLIVIALMVVIY